MHSDEYMCQLAESVQRFAEGVRRQLPLSVADLAVQISWLAFCDDGHTPDNRSYWGFCDDNPPRGAKTAGTLWFATPTGRSCYSCRVKTADILWYDLPSVDRLRGQLFLFPATWCHNRLAGRIVKPPCYCIRRPPCRSLDELYALQAWCKTGIDDKSPVQYVDWLAYTLSSAVELAGECLSSARFVHPASIRTKYWGLDAQ